MLKTAQKVELIVNGDGSVWRTAFCDCGKVIYKKNLTNDKIQLLVGGKTPFNKYSNISVPSNPSQLKLECPYCNMEHIVVGIF